LEQFSKVHLWDSFATNWKASSENGKTSLVNWKVTFEACCEEHWLCMYIAKKIPGTLLAELNFQQDAVQ